MLEEIRHVGVGSVGVREMRIDGLWLLWHLGRLHHIGMIREVGRHGVGIGLMMKMVGFRRCRRCPLMHRGP